MWFKNKQICKGAWRPEAFKKKKKKDYYIYEISFYINLMVTTQKSAKLKQLAQRKKKQRKEVWNVTKQKQQTEIERKRTNRGTERTESER